MVNLNGMSDSIITSPVEPTCAVQVDYSECINFAFQQNSIPILRRIEIQNNSEKDWQNITCKIDTQPGWAEPHYLKITQIPASTAYTLTDIPLKLEIDYLAELSERVHGEIRMEIRATVIAIDQDESPEDEVIYEQTFSVNVYAHDEWTGLRSLPEILAAFVTPNLAIVEQILSNTTHILGKRTSSSALDGYQAHSKKRVYEIIDAVYDALREQSISYSNPAASFENTGQRIRFGTRILKSKLATCLDLSLLFASILEQAGLHPLVLMHKGHAYVGCWLIEHSFSDAATDDLQSIRKRKDLEELLVFESTLVCDGKNVDFKRAVAAAQPHLSLDDEFEVAIDIFRCRSSRIHPLPLERNEGGVDVQQAHQAQKTRVDAAHSRAQDVEFKDELNVDNAPKTQEGRIDHWKQQLLDLTLRNRLLNFKETKQTIPLLCPQPEQMEDELAADQIFKVLEQTPLIAGMDPRSLSLQAQQTDEDPVLEHLMRELHAKRLRSSLTESELSRRLLELYRKIRLENEESGANTLFLALGCLEWKQNLSDDRSYRAPLLLVPVQLSRKSVQSGFSLQRHDEDTLVNVTLLELLKRDYQLDVPGVNPPPEDDSGVDVDMVFRLFQHAVRDLPGWEVHREVWLAQFSFSKFLLWKDLQDRADILSKNAVVDHLMNHAGAPFFDDQDALKPSELDDSLGFDQIFCPMSSDSSQLAATLAAANGKNFVMNGPPGTGKSQTITNIISHCLAEGKRVLFVAEKRAALEVVHHRLSQIGLGPFCLELHSKKSGKAEVLRQFGEAINYVEQHPGEEWELLASRLNHLRGELNSYVRELHKVYPNKLSAYQCYSWLIAQENCRANYQSFDHVDIPDLENHTREALEELEETCDQLVLRGNERRLPIAAKEALQPIKATEWTPQWEDEVFTVTAKLLSTIKELRPCWIDVAPKLGMPVDNAPESILECVANLTASLRNAPVLPPAFITDSNWATVFKPQAEAWIASGQLRDQALTNLEGFNIGALENTDTDALERSFKETEKKGGVLKTFKHWLQLKPVRQARKAGAAKWTSAQAPEFFKNISQLNAEQATLDAAKTEATARFGIHWCDGASDWGALQKLLKYGDELQANINILAGNSVELTSQLRSKIGKLISTDSEFLQEGGAIETLFANFGTLWGTFVEVLRKHQRMLQLSESARNVLEQTETFCNQLIAQRHQLAAWCRWQSAYKSAEDAGLMTILKAVNSGILPLEDLRNVFDFAYRNTFLKRLLTLSPVLRDFYGEEHQKRIDAFSDFDNRYTELTGRVVAARLASRLPRARSEECPRNTELGLIQREMVKRRRHKPVRKLLAETPGVAPYLKPCFLMSPLSVAQYLDAEQTEFDVVVFDEASQIPVWDAVGAIARGKQVIVVGDPKQLPPTNFFSRSDGDDTFIDNGQTEDLESILDECLGSGLKVYNLLWHYRSRKEGLIAFSNYQYYNNELHTFPSPHSDNTGVSLVPVPHGFYDKGKSRTNKAEAEAITEEVIRRLSDPALSEMSIGIVTFSQAQQNLILDLLDEARRNYPEIEAHFGEEFGEPVFVKNLENVQGDERDVILFSICYGPDQVGKLSMNFGPLNRDGGERRLNVAVTRAKHEVVIFSTLRSEQIDLSRTRALGAAHLKAYLEYAERGPVAIAGNIESAETDEYDSIFEKEVAEFLRSKGYTVHTQIGCSGYRVDLAIVKPDTPGHYLLGIECDGASYHRAATARDRDRLRQAVLEGLGWRIYRIWSTDWWRNATIAKEDLLAEIEAALKEPEKSVVSVIPSTPDEKVDPEPGEIKYASDIPVPTLTADDRMQEYPSLTLQSYEPADDFYVPKSRAVIQKQIGRIIENEGPITADLLTRRVAQEWGFSRVASKIKKIVQDNLPSSVANSARDENSTYWPKAIDPESYRIYRIADRDVRKFEDTPLEELCNAALDILEKYIAFPKEDFAAEVARHFGFSRVAKSTAQLCEAAIQKLLSHQVISIEGNDYKIL
jgi:very-short-patch-repair endonuclease